MHWIFQEYKVGNDGSESKIFSFKTFPKYDAFNSWSPEVVVFGDLSDKDGKIYGRLTDEVRQGKVDMVVHLGDLAYDLHWKNGRVGDSFMRKMEPIAAYVPYQVAPGNHEEA